MKDVKLTLLEHLEELRSRLWKVVLAVLLAGGVSLVWARELFGLMMRPVLSALPEDARALVYTSGIEEINVLLKVGLYAGIFVAVPIALYQIWAFVAPGLLPSERRWVAPFVGFGSLFFVGGALFCYLVVLPSMFKLLLTPGDAGEMRDRIALSRAQADDAARLYFAGEPGKATELALKAEKALAESGNGSIPAPPVLSASRVEIGERMARLGVLLNRALGRTAHKETVRAIELRAEANAKLAEGTPFAAAQALEQAVQSLEEGAGADKVGLAAIWSAHKHVAAAIARLGEVEWTRPMLSMREQLSLVLVLEVAFGLIFELPLIMALLAVAGLLRARHVFKFQRYAILACVTVAAVVTPTGDVVNLAMMAVPMVVCFELGAVLVWVLERRRKPETPEEPDALAG